MYRFKPEGRHHLEFCTNLSCALYGADELIAETCRRLGVQEGETTADGNFTVRRVECLAACGGGPALQVDGRWVENVTVADLDPILSGKLTRRPFEWPKSPGEAVILRNVWKPNSASIDVYEAGGGYAKLKDHLSMKPDDIVETVKKSSLRGRGGAGFPTGMKWGFLPKDNPKPRYLCVNADESEPGTFKDRLIIENDPHQLIEACVISTHAIRSKVCYIYIRGEFHEGIQILEKAVAEAYAAGYAGKNILGTGVDVDVYVHGGAGAYECGEETALLESLEGKRGQPRLKPPFPATHGLYGCPTIVNNVETIACVTLILERGAEWFAAQGTEKNGGPKLYCVSGHVKRPGTYEAPMGKITLRQLIYDSGYGGGMREGRKLRAVVPGGSSTPVLTDPEIDVAMDFDSLAKAGSMLGSAGTIVMDDSTCMVWMARKLTYFYKHESCGKCSPCREGTGWMLRLLDRIEEGAGSERDLDILWNVCDSIAGKTLCPFGDAAIAPPQSTLKKFRDEYEYHVREKRCWRRVAKTFEEAKALAAQPVTAR
jgi:NADH-quinone oxidoreductase subunit F